MNEAINMRHKKPITSILVSLAILAVAGIVPVSSFAATQIPVIATATIAPEGQYAPVITVTDQALRETETLEFEVLAADANTTDTVRLEITQGQTPWLTIVSNTDGNPSKMVVRAAPPTGAIGRHRLFFKATDNSPTPLNSEKDIYITVNPANEPPVITAQNQAVVIGNTLSFTVNCQDPNDRDTVTFTYSGKPAWLNASSSSPVTGNPIDVTFTGTPQASDVNTYTMTFNAVDDGTPQQSATKEITIIVSRTNHPPVLSPIRDKEVANRMKLEFRVSATDPDADSLSYTAALADGRSLSTINAQFANQTFIWTPRTDQVGTYVVRFEVSDGALTDSEDITIYVNANDAPVFEPFGDLHAKVGRALLFVVIARDPNNDPITYAASNLPSGATFDPSTHALTWTPQPGQEGIYRDVAFSASDGTFTATKTIWIYVRPFNAPDLSFIGDKYGTAGQTLSFDFSATDPNPGDTLTFSYSPQNLPGGPVTFSYDSQGRATFQWSNPPAGTYRDIMFTVTDSAGLTDSKIIWIFIQPNTAPLIEHIGDKYTIEGRLLSFTVNATDPDGDPLTYSALNLPVGAVFNTSTHQFSWTPAIGEAGEYRDVRFQVSDGVNTTRENIWIFVSANGAPVFDPLEDKYVKAGQLLQFAVSAYDPEGNNLTYRVLNLPSGATFNNRVFSWTPSAAQIGTYRDIIFEVSDGANVSRKGIWIFVTPSDAPVLAYIGDKYTTAGQGLTFNITATDPNNDTMRFWASNLPSGAGFADNNNGTATFTWTNPQAGTYRDVLFTVSDGTYTDTKGIWIFVRSAGAPAIRVPGDQRVKAGSPLQFTITAADPDTPQSGLTFSASNLPLGAMFDNQVFNWTPTPQQVGTYPDIFFNVTDGVNADSKVIWIFVTAAGAPEFTQDIADKYGRIGEPIVFSVSATDPDNNPSQLTYSAYNLPAGARFANQTFTWTPQAGQAGTYRDVRIEVRDPDNNVASDAFWIFISQNSAPELQYIGTIYGAASQPLTRNISATDADGNQLTFSASNLPQGAALVDNGNGTATLNWANPQAGTYSGVRITVSDGALTASETISIEISP